ncbi:MAG: amidase [Pseudomonadota bacterium]
MQDTALKARAALAAAQGRPGISAQICGDVVEAEVQHRAALTEAGCTLGPLHGLPIVVKDIIDLAGHPTRAGSALRADQPAATADANVVARLRAAGAITVAKSKTVEFAFGGWGTNASQGTPNNPWKPDEPHTPGGSSSGTGAAVGGRFVPAGLGTDTGGSVRIPAAFCGCVGLKTSIGMVSRSGVVPLSDSFDTVGPLTDTVQRAAEMLEAMMGEDRTDPTTVGRSRGDPLADLDRGVQGLRIGVVQDDALYQATPDVMAAFHDAQRMLAEAGATLVPFSLPKDFATYQGLATAIISSDAYAFHAEMADSNATPLNDTTRTRILACRDMTAADRVRAQRSRRADISAYLHAMDRLDAVVLPTAPTNAIPLSTVNEDDYTVSLYTRPGNYLDLCGLSVPVGVSPAGLPTAVQIMARQFDDPLALRIGKTLEDVRGAFPNPPSLA